MQRRDEWGITNICRRMWAVLDEVVDLNESDVYSYNPDADDDPMNEDGYL